MSELKTNKIQTNDTNNVAIDNALGLKSYDTTGRDALTSVAGDTIYNTTTSKVEYYDGSSWQQTGSSLITINYLVVGGGGAGSGAQGTWIFAGGGGAGGVITSLAGSTVAGSGLQLPTPAFISASTNYRITVGGGGSNGSGNNAGNSGTYSEAFGVTAFGGGAGRGFGATGLNGASGGGSGNFDHGTGLYSQGHDGEQGGWTGDGGGRGGGGGGASAAGAAGTGGGASTGGNGGAGIANSITGSSVTYAGGGGGAGYGTLGTGGSGGGGNGGQNGSGSNATINTGGGGGGGGANTSVSGGSGGSGIVILRWATADANIGATRTGLTDGGVQTDGSDSYIVFTGGTGTISFS